MIGKPGFRCCLLPIGQKRHSPSSLQITDDRPVAMIAPPCPVIDADDCKPLYRGASTPAHDTEQRVVTHRHHEASGKAGRWPAAEREPEMMNKAI